MEFTGGTITMAENYITNCYTDDEGGVIKMNGGNLIETESTYEQNAALKGGVFYCDGCNLDIFGTTFINNKAVLGGAIYSTGDSTLTIEGITASDLQATGAGSFLYVDDPNNDGVTVTIGDYTDGLGVVSTTSITNCE